MPKSVNAITPSSPGLMIASHHPMIVANPAAPAVRREAEEDWGRKRAMAADRRFPPPWSAEETDACFIVRDANGQAALA
jgi:hypothetical protein